MFTNPVWFSNSKRIRMKTRFSALFLLVLVDTLSTAGSAHTLIYKALGDTVVLEPPTSPTSAINKILWKQNTNLAVEWAGGELEPYSVFKDRIDLKTSTGELTISNLTVELSGNYTVQINGQLLDGSTTLKVISPVPKPWISVFCNEEKNQCTLSCEGNVSAMDPKPTYTWIFNNTKNQTPNNILQITPETSAPEFICELQNPVSQESSQPVNDPFFQEVTAVSDGLNINTGLIVCLCLLASVVGVALVHRVKSGMWFYEKDSMPWEADFWKKTESSASFQPQLSNDDTAERNSIIESNS